LLLTAVLILRPLFEYFRDSRNLRRLPNASPISGITNLWFVFQAYKGQRYFALMEKHHNHPHGPRPVLRIAPNHVSFTDPQAIKDIHGHGTVMEKGVHYDLVCGTHRHLADVVDRSEHQRKRKVMAAAFAQSNIETYEHVLAKKMGHFLAQMDKLCAVRPKTGSRPPPEAPTMDYRRWAILYTQEAISALGFSEDLGFLEKGDDLTTAERADGTLYQARYRDAIEGGMHKAMVLIAFPEWYKALVAWACLLLPSFRNYKKRSQGFTDICRHITRKRIRRQANGEQLSDIFTALLHSRNGQPNNYPFGELFAEANVILNAGSDSTGIAMTNTIYSLIENPRALAILREELDEALGSTDVVAPYGKIKYCAYLRAVLDESMRMYAPSQFSLPRKTPPEGASIAGHWIAGDTQVTTPTHAIHMDPSIWGDPETFRPERWLGEEGKLLQRHFLVFTTGPRGCIGRNVTYLEQYVMLASFVKRYEFCLEDESFTPTRYETAATLIDKLPLKIWRR
ncbi:putative cytochrome P450 monooxygenase, partial [Mytilinidion resinicola]